MSNNVFSASLATFPQFVNVWRQVRARRYERLNDFYDDEISAGGGTVSNFFSSQFIDVLLSVFLFVWFVCGNYWVLSVWPPNYRQTLTEPNSWCAKTAYVFALVQLSVRHVKLIVLDDY